MEIIDVMTTPPLDSKPLILMIGKFDGIHIAHQAIIQTARALKSKEDHLAVMSFSDHPLWVLKQDHEYKKKLTPDKEKIQILEKWGIERFYRIHFTKDYAKITAEEFILDHISRLNVKHIVVGEGFHFGNGRESGTRNLIEYCATINVQVTVVPLVTLNEEKISSSKIRTFINEGKMEAVTTLLNRPYTITGAVIHGNALGRTLGFPTINLGDVDSYVLPKPGVYLGKVKFHDEAAGEENWNVLISAGFRPTVNGGGYLIEAYLIDFSGDLYDKTVTLSFLRYLRGEIKFTGLEALMDQMNQDKQEAKRLLGMS